MISGRNKSSIFNFNSFSGRKVNLVGELGGENQKFPVLFKSTLKKKINLRKTRTFRQNNGSSKFWILE